MPTLPTPASPATLMSLHFSPNYTLLTIPTKTPLQIHLEYEICTPQEKPMQLHTHPFPPPHNQCTNIDPNLYKSNHYTIWISLPGSEAAMQQKLKKRHSLIPALPLSSMAEV